jgi:hypothetical protein
MKFKNIEIDGNRFTITELSSSGFSVGCRQWRKPVDTNHFIIKTVHSDFNTDNFSFPHTPIVIEEVINRKFSRQNDIRVLDCPIKFPGSSEYRIPRELMQFDETIAKVISFEHAINPFINDYYAYLTIDQSGVDKDRYHRNPGCYVDGFQPARINPKRPIGRAYIAYDCLPPVFYAQSFKLDHLDEARDDFFFALDDQADETAEVIFDPYQIVLMNAYTVHKSIKANEGQYRTFFRLTYDVNIFDRFGNTHNPMFNYKWTMVSRDTQKHLKQRRLRHPHAF